jgi:hypothetical protein
MNRRRTWFLLPGLVAAVTAAILLPGGASSGPLAANNVLARQLAIETGHATRAKWEQPVSSGAMYAALQASGALDARANAVQGPGGLSSPNTQGCQNTFSGTFANVRVNQDCSLRRQAEEVVVANPNNVNNLIAGQNDSSIGFNKCGYDFSFDGGSTWGSLIPPFYQFQLGDGHTADACSDPTATFDANGNAYIAGVLFDVSFPASAFVVSKSNAPIGGAFYHTPDSTLSFQTYRSNPLGVVANDNNACIFHDKEFIVADASPASSKKNNVYATWTRFNSCTGQGVGGDSPIYFSQSTNGGKNWSAGIEISGSSASLCTVFSGEANANACDQDQGSHPIVGRDGTIYVAFGNGNTPGVNINQHLIVRCGSPTNPLQPDCSNPANWTAPTKIGDDFGYQPLGPDATSGCPGGRQCLPTNGYRLDDFVEGSISVDNSNRLYAVWADGRNIAANCHPNGSVSGATPPCDNDVFYAYSTDSGATWSSTRKVTPAGSAQWQPWSAVTPDGSRLYIGYYDRSYGSCETTGCNDITLTAVTNAATGSPSYSSARVTTASMPNLVVANNPLEAGFLGDYMWVTVDKNGRAYLVWADTRGQSGTVEEDIYLAKTP